MQAEITTTTSLLPTTQGAIYLAGQLADQHARENTFSDYTSRKAANTISAQHFDLQCFAEYLRAIGIPDAPGADDLQSRPGAWGGVSWGLVAGFVQWMLKRGL